MHGRSSGLPDYQADEAVVFHSLATPAGWNLLAATRASRSVLWTGTLQWGMGVREGGEVGKGWRGEGVCLFVCWLLNVPATCECISGTDLLRQFYVRPH